MKKAKRARKPAADAIAPMTTADATVATLTAHGIDTIYALPGVHNDHFFDALARAGDSVRTVHARRRAGRGYPAPPLVASAGSRSAIDKTRVSDAGTCR
jgi:glyoxylate carboligase